MKKFSISVLVLVTTLFCVNALTFGEFTITPVSINPLYAPYKADSWNTQTRGQVIYLQDGAPMNKVLLATRYEEGREDYYLNFDSIQQPMVEDYIYELADFIDSEDGVERLYRMKTGLNFGLFRVAYKDFQIEGSLQGAVNLVFDADHGTDCIGFDGIYFLGFNAKYKDLIATRFGFHHYSSHYGDEIEEEFMIRTDELGRQYASRFSYKEDEPSYIARLAQYVRQDSLVAGVSVTPLSWLRIYTEIDIPPAKMANIRPWVLIPNYVRNNDGTTTMVDKNGHSEDVCSESEECVRKYSYSDSYKAVSLNIGAEFAIPINNWGSIILAYDCKLNQEGQTCYQVGAYSENNAWDVDHNILVGFEFEDFPLTAEFIYHNGRFPLMNYYWYNCSYCSIGFSVEL